MTGLVRIGVLLGVCVIVCSAAESYAQAARVTPNNAWVVARLDGPVTLDGMPDEPAWANVAPFPLTMNFPSFEGEQTERTEIRIAYDGDFLYAAGHFYDTEPDAIRGLSLARDNGADSDDMFALIIDTFDDNENALAFITTPAGIRIDQSIFNDAQMTRDGMPFNESWNTFWDVATVVNEDGWFAEMRIPFSSLRFQDDNGRVEMGLLAWRWISRKTEGHTFPPVAPREGMLGPFKPSIARPIVLEGVYSRKPVYITPYVLGGVQQTQDLNEAATAYEQHNDFTEDLGLDVKYALTSNLTLDATLNTDFAQVEADDAQVNLTRFSLFFPEKRQFFQERSSIFDFKTGGPTRLFYSRTVGLTDEGPVRILGGARLVGRVGQWDVGALNMQTARSRFDTDDGLERFPAENFGVVRLRRQVFNENSYAGGIVTTRMGDDGSYNIAYGLDGTFKLRGTDFFLLNLAQTFEDEQSVDGLSTGLLRARFERRANEGLIYDLGVTRVGEDYNPGMGFIFRTGFTRLGDEVSYTWTGPENSFFFNYSAGLNGSVFLRNEDGSVESAELGPTSWFAFRTGGFIFVEPKVFFENLRESFELSDDVEVPVGDYTFFGTTVFYQMGPKLLRTGAFGTVGSFYDGWRMSVGLQPAWNVSRFLELSGDLQFNHVAFPDRDASFTANVYRLRLQMAFNTKLSFATFAQYSTLADNVTVNARLRYNFREGNDLYIVYNEGLNTDRPLDRPRLPISDTRTVLLKYTYTLVY